MIFSGLFGFLLFIGKFSAANESIGFRLCSGFFVFRFYKVSGQRSDLIFAEFCVAPSLEGFLSNRRLGRVDLSGGLGMAFRLRLCARIRQEPAWQSAGETTRNIAAAWAGGRDTARRAGRKLFRSSLLVVYFGFSDRCWSLGCHRSAAILCK
jgi:hypothetical protein